MLFLLPETVRVTKFSLDHAPGKPQQTLDAAESPKFFAFSAKTQPLSS
jgi:hypothetical protein